MNIMRLSNVFGGGGNLTLLSSVLGGCENQKLCYNSDEYPHINNGVLGMKKAFTLAEVLVTLGIIGVVSAMTVPTLMQNHQRKTYVTQLHKVYNEISQVLLQYQSDKNAVNLTEAGLTSTAALQNMITSYMKIVATCDSVAEPCFSDSYKYINGNSAAGAYTNNVKSYVLASGAAIRPVYSKPSTYKIANFMVDINGAKGPNISGRDLFFLYLYSNGIIDEGPDETVNNAPLTEDQREALNCETSLNGCFGRLLNDNWEMNY